MDEASELLDNTGLERDRLNAEYCFVVDKRSVLDKLSLKTWGAPAPARKTR